MPAPSRFPPTGQLLSAMLSHRERVLRQVSGEPQGALDAFVKRFRSMSTQAGSELKWRRGDEDALSRVDRALVDLLVKERFLSHPHQVEQHDQDAVSMGPHAIPNHGVPGTVVMASNRVGDFEPGSFFEANSDPKWVAKRWAHQDGVMQTYQRWFILLHELAHCEYPAISNPFRPTPGRHDEAFVGAMNRWIMGPLSLSSRSAKNLLNEGHSDAMAAIMLTHVSSEDPTAEAVVQKNMEARIRIERKVASKIAANLLVGAHQRGDFVDEHCTGAVLHRILEEKEQWRGLPGKKIRGVALQYASDGFMERLSIQDPLGKFHAGLPPEMRAMPVSRVLSEALVDADLKPDNLKSMLFWLWYVEGSGGSAQGWFSAQDQSHPLLPVLKGAFLETQARPRIRQVRELYDSSAKKDAFTLGIRRGAQWLNEQMNQEFVKVLGRTCAPDNPAWCHAQEMHRQDMEIVRQGLGLPDRPRSPAIALEDLHESSRPSPSRTRIPGR